MHFNNGNKIIIIIILMGNRGRSPSPTAVWSVLVRLWGAPQSPEMTERPQGWARIGLAPTWRGRAA